MGKRWLCVTIPTISALLLLAGCTNSDDGQASSTAGSEQTATSRAPVDQCSGADESELTLEIEPSTAPAGSSLYVVWPEDQRPVALSLDDGEQIWLLIIGNTESEAETVPFETVGTYPPAVAQVPGVGYVKLPPTLRDGCYLILAGSSSGTVTVVAS